MPRDDQGRRKTKKAKSRRNYELNGKYSAKAVRAFEEQVSNRKSIPQEDTETEKDNKKKSKKSKK